MIFTFLILFPSSKNQNYTFEQNCTENEKLSSQKDLLFCCDIVKKGDTLIQETPMQIVRTIAPNVCMMLSTIGPSQNRTCVCKTGYDLKKTTPRPQAKEMQVDR